MKTNNREKPVTSTVAKNKTMTFWALGLVWTVGWFCFLYLYCGFSDPVNLFLALLMAVAIWAFGVSGRFVVMTKSRQRGFEIDGQLYLWE
jgi:hypothetical protein